LGLVTSSLVILSKVAVLAHQQLGFHYQISAACLLLPGGSLKPEPLVSIAAMGQGYCSAVAFLYSSDLVWIIAIIPDFVNQT